MPLRDWDREIGVTRAYCFRYLGVCRLVVENEGIRGTGKIGGNGDIGKMDSFEEMDVLDRKNVITGIIRHLWLTFVAFCNFSGNRMPYLGHLESVLSRVEDVCTLKCLQWCSKNEISKNQ